MVADHYSCQSFGSCDGGQCWCTAQKETIDRDRGLLAAHQLISLAKGVVNRPSSILEGVAAARYSSPSSHSSSPTISLFFLFVFNIRFSFNIAFFLVFQFVVTICEVNI